MLHGSIGKSECFIQERQSEYDDEQDRISTGRLATNSSFTQMFHDGTEGQSAFAALQILW